MSATANLRRLQNEVRALQSQNDEAKMFRTEMVDDNMYHWAVTMYGPPDSLYEGYEFKLDVNLPRDYPFSPPRVKFLTRIQHVNVNSNGDICLDILKDKWAASQNIKTVLISICVLLSSPNPDDPFNSDLAELYRTDKDKYLEKVKTACEKYAKP